MTASASFLTDHRLRILDRALDRLHAALPYDYAQWVVEAPGTRDYVVVASRVPEGGEGYGISHRPGVIGQVFRRQRAIFIPEVAAHPLYDLYDPAVSWELAVPVFARRKLAAVLNLEGCGALTLDDGLWRRLAARVAETGWNVSGGPPAPGEAWMARTSLARAPLVTAIGLGEAAARGGSWVLVAGPLELPVSRAYPTVREALERGEPLGGCVRGGAPRLDLLPAEIPAGAAGPELPWWPLVDGRYDFVLLAEPDPRTQGAPGACLP